MALNQPTLVVRFGAAEGSEADYVLTAELDDVANGGKSSFEPGEKVYFLVHHSANVQLVSVVPSSGSVAKAGIVTRSATDSVQFATTDDEQDLSHVPSGALSTKWYGSSASLTLSGYTTLKASAAPVSGTVTYNYNAIQYVLTPPPMTLGPDDEFTILIVITGTEILVGAV